MTSFIYLALLTLFFMFSPLQATEMEKAFADSKTWAGSLLNSQSGVVSNANKHEIPGYQTDAPPEASLDPHALEEKGRERAQSDETARSIIEASRTRPQFKIDPKTDPWLTGSNEILETQGERFTVTEIETPGVDEVREIVCEEAAETREITAVRRLTAIRLVEKKDEFTHSWYWHSGHNPQQWTQSNFLSSESRWSHDDGCNWHRNWYVNVYRYYSREVLYNIAKAEVEKELTPWAIARQGSHWDEKKDDLKTCEPHDNHVKEAGETSYPHDVWVGDLDIEDYSDQNACAYVSRECIEPQETRINGAPITRPCWAEKLTYACQFGDANSCAYWRGQGCVEIDSRCLQKIGDWCGLYEKTLQCKTVKCGGAKVSFGPDKPFCAGGDCFDSGYSFNGDMIEAVSRLMALREMHKQMDTSNLSVFKGLTRHCDKHRTGFTDCCSAFSGWGVRTGLSKCSGDEKLLAQKRKEGLCHQVGTFVVEKAKVIGWLRKRTSYCCFESKLSRLIQEQGRAQLGIGWGSPEQADCRGLTPQELGQVNFEQLNLTEIYQDIKVSAPSPEVIAEKLKTKTQSLQSSFDPKKPAISPAGEGL